MTGLQLTAGAPGARILGFGSYRPRRRVTNDELAQTMETNDEWIQGRAGIPEGGGAAPDETPVEVSVAAGGKGLAASGLGAPEVDLASLGPDRLAPPIPPPGPG